MSSPVDVRRSKPRVRRAPRSVSNDVDDAVFLASSYGLTPDEWQEDVLESWLGRRRDGRWSARTCGLAVPRQNGKNGAIEVRELFGMVGLGEKFLHTAHEVKTARKAFLRIASFFENPRKYPELAALVKDIRKTNGQEAVILTNGGSVEFIARSKGSGRGFTVDVLVCDEAQDLSDEELAALLPTISAAPSGNPQVIVTGTPPDPLKRGTGAVFRRIRADGEAGRDARLAWTDFGAPDGPMPDIENRALWGVWNPALGIRLALNEVERELGLMSSETFARERAGWWGDPEADAASVVDLRAWAGLKDPDAPAPAGSVALVIDVSPDRRSSSIGIATSLGDRTLLLVESAGGVSWVVPKVAQYVAERNVAVVALHPSSQAGALIPDLVEAGVEFEALTVQNLGAACAGFIEGVSTGRFVHVGQPELDAAIGNARTRFSSEVELWDRRKRDIDISPLVAVSAAAYRWALLASPDYDVLDSIF